MSAVAKVLIYFSFKLPMNLIRCTAIDSNACVYEINIAIK